MNASAYGFPQNNVFANAVFSTQDNLTVPRVSIDMSYDLGTRLDSVHAVFIDKRALSRVEALIVGVPQSMTFSSTIGDIFLIDVDVPPQCHSSDTLFCDLGGQRSIIGSGVHKTCSSNSSSS